MNKISKHILQITINLLAGLAIGIIYISYFVHHVIYDWKFKSFKEFKKYYNF